ncbi:MAG TPA: CHAT domain-containing protein, partial [Pyrinomonadaceae bacterium]|nr:CHAT domain-containing protein [Pyrinomonadaceae bacterium]
SLQHPVPLSLQDIQQKVVDPDTVLLEYALGPDNCYLWVVTSDSLQSQRLPSSTLGIKEATSKLIGMLTATGGTVRSFEAEAQKLSKMLLPPIAVSTLKSKRTLLVVTNGILQSLPFSILSLPGESASYTPLVVSHNLISLPSASTLNILRDESRNRWQPVTKTIMVLADPVFSDKDERVTGSSPTRRPINPRKKVQRTSSTFPQQSESEIAKRLALGDRQTRAGVRLLRLPGTRLEAQMIKQLAPDANVALDFDANLTTATSPDMATYRIVHFATHGIAPDDHPELSGVVLSLVNERGEAREGYLGLPMVYNLNLPVDLVVLSACETGLGEEVRGEGLIGLTRGFMYAGAPRVIASLWKVREGATEELMRRFYTAIFKKGMKPAAALSYAEASMWREQKWAPSDWSGFIFFGEWQ